MLAPNKRVGTALLLEKLDPDVLVRMMLCVIEENKLETKAKKQHTSTKNYSAAS